MFLKSDAKVELSYESDMDIIGIGKKKEDNIFAVLFHHLSV